MKVTKWRVVLTVVIALIITISFSGCAVGKGKVAVIRLSGIIADSSQQGLLTTGGISPKQVRDYLRKAESDGGMGDVAASGGYYISAYADRLVANPSTLTGSIGVISHFIYIEGLLEKLGLELETIKTGKHKDMGIWPLTEEQRQIMQDITDDLYEQFVAAVAEGRGLPVTEVRQLATGQLYTGVQALNLGLVDELGGLETAIELASSLAGITTPEIEEYSPPASFIEKLLGGLALPSLLLLSEDELLFLRMLEGWQGIPRY